MATRVKQPKKLPPVTPRRHAATKIKRAGAGVHQDRRTRRARTRAAKEAQALKGGE
jgi:hypothetical protein